MSKSVLIAIVLLTANYTKGKAQTGTNQPVMYAIQRSEKVEIGKPFSVDVLFKVESEWYLYAPTGKNAAQGMIETRVTYSLPEGIRRVEKMQVPEPLYKNGYEVLEGNIVMSQSFMASAPGDYTIRGKIIYQSCSEDICMPPVSDEFTTSIHVN